MRPKLPSWIRSQETQAAVDVFFGDADDQTKVRFGEFFFRYPRDGFAGVDGSGPCDDLAAGRPTDSTTLFSISAVSSRFDFFALRA